MSGPQRQILPAGRSSGLTQRGYNLVEMAIVLAVIGLLLGMSLEPFGTKFRTKRNNEVKQQLELIEQAVLGYAMQHQTQPAVVVMDDPIMPTLRLRSQIPGDRPYLPCPDVTGDGFEDRLPLPDASISVSASLLTVVSPTATVTLAVPEIVPMTVTMHADRNTNQLLTSISSDPGYGNCIRDKGMVPWATLGTPPSDPWGSRFTYRVDPLFANSLIGIGTETRSDTLDPRMPLALTISLGTTLTIYQRRLLSNYIAGELTVTLANNPQTITTAIDDRPGLVCTRTVDTDGCSMESYASIATAGGLLINSNVTTQVTMFDVTVQTTVARLYEDGDITSGMAFVILSHGANASGAVPHHGGRNNLLNTALTCNVFEGTIFTWLAAFPEIENSDSVDYCQIDGVMNLPDDNLGTLPQPHNSSFVDMPENNVTYFDDKLIYMNDVELLNVLSARGAKLDQPFIPPGPF